MTKQNLRISGVMKKSAEAVTGPHSAEAILEAVINEIRASEIPFAKLTVVSPTMTSLRLKCEMPDNHDGIKKTMVAVNGDVQTVNVRRDIDPGQDTAFPFDPVVIKGLSLKDAAKAVVDEIRRMHDMPVPARKVTAGQPAARM